MTMLDRLSAAFGLRTPEATRATAARCLREPGLLQDIADGLSGQSARHIGDCAEVMVNVAETFPLLIVPYIGRLGTLLNHPTTRVRAEAVHAVALVAAYAPQQLLPLVRTLASLARDDASAAVRDYAVDALWKYGAMDESSALAVFAPLRDALPSSAGKQRARILAGFARIAPAAPRLASELRMIAEAQSRSGKSAVRSAAEQLLQALDR